MVQWLQYTFIVDMYWVHIWLMQYICHKGLVFKNMLYISHSNTYSIIHGETIRCGSVLAIYQRDTKSNSSIYSLFSLESITVFYDEGKNK